MAEHTVDIPAFRLLFPAFSDPVKFTDAYITAQFTAATMFLGAYDGCLLAGDQLQLALNYMTAHLMQLNVAQAAGGGGSGVTGVVTGATIDKVSVTLAAPTTKSGWQYWLSTTPFGALLWALLSAKSAGGFYIGGRPERRAFRKVGGVF